MNLVNSRIIALFLTPLFQSRSVLELSFGRDLCGAPGHLISHDFEGSILSDHQVIPILQLVDVARKNWLSEARINVSTGCKVVSN